MLITRAEFKCSSERLSQIPQDGLRDFAFIGRSNVGKSSLINMLTGNAGLAKVSGKPGKTRLINHFTINREWYLVDLPGYGYARASKSERAKFSKIITSYVTRSRKLHLLFVLIDSRLEPQRIDLEFFEMLGESGIPFAIVFTKSDKLSKNQLSHSIESYKSTLLEQWDELPPIFITSSERRSGREELLDYIDSLLQQIALTESGEQREGATIPINFDDDERLDDEEAEDDTFEPIEPDIEESEENIWVDDDMGMSEAEFAENMKQYINRF